ncbi:MULTISPECIES: arylamine N-acetyltransferase [Streptomyces]|uniref:Arylamine N-acetyltransferase n=1 Tax=Streptomyces lycii TaxID=2654337 RepID=A0ABQ7FHP1_9ACTN|nr:MULTISPECIES: arylamine N-acetyltransferase [Streptomyces]KAF4406762.1 arylamine N-acetyltransferase [Streptomyces lycii]PGH48387.1 arylamine N-acetyltransferase [Streptomyces sp. Ru87]
MTEGLDIDRYLARIGRPETGGADADTLRALHRAHVLSVPFENVESLLGSAPSLALADLERKLVGSRRGGYCFEHNTLFAAALRGFGFEVTGLGARVRLGGGDGAVRPRTHLLSLVRVPGEPGPYLADVGFGTSGLLEAVPLVADAVTDRGGWELRLVREPREHGPADVWVLQRRGKAADGTWTDLYDFTLEPFEPADVQMANWYVATYPRSPFRTGLIARRVGVDRQLSVDGRVLAEELGDGTRSERKLVEDGELLRVLAEDFGIELPEGTRLPL